MVAEESDWRSLRSPWKTGGETKTTMRISIGFLRWLTNHHNNNIFFQDGWELTIFQNLVGAFNHLEKYILVNGQDYPFLYYGKEKMFQTTNQ